MEFLKPKTLTMIGNEEILEQTINDLKEINKRKYIIIASENSKKIQGAIIVKLIVEEL